MGTQGRGSHIFNSWPSQQLQGVDKDAADGSGEQRKAHTKAFESLGLRKRKKRGVSLCFLLSSSFLHVL